MESTTAIDAARGEVNIFDLDADVAIGPSDVITFKCYHTKTDIPVISKTLTGITNAQGQFQITLVPADTTGLTVENTQGDVVAVYALMYEVTIDQGGGAQLVASGVMYLVG